MKEKIKPNPKINKCILSINKFNFIIILYNIQLDNKIKNKFCI